MKHCCKILKIVLQCVMILFLLFYTYERIEKLLEEDTGMSYTIMEDGGAELPSFTICFYEFRKNRGPLIYETKSFEVNMTFEEFMKQSFVVKDYINVAKYEYGSSIENTRTTIDLLDQKDNKEIWQESYYLHTKFFYGISRCVTINSPVKTLVKPNDFDLILEFNMTTPKTLLLEVHPRYQSLMNQDYTWENIYYFIPGKVVWRTFSPTIFKSVKTKHQDCNEENSLKVTQCFDNFYMSKLNCSFPWLKSDDNNYGSLEKCGSKHKVYDLINLIKGIADPDSDIHKELSTKGCNIPNCVNTKWREEKSDGIIHFNFTTDKFDLGRSCMTNVFPSSSKVKVAKQVLVYTFEDLISDFGGIMGLLLGASIISLYDMIKELAFKISTHFYHRKNDEFHL